MNQLRGLLGEHLVNYAIFKQSLKALLDRFYCLIAVIPCHKVCNPDFHITRSTPLWDSTGLITGQFNKLSTHEFRVFYMLYKIIQEHPIVRRDISISICN